MKRKGTKNITYTQRLILESCLNAGLSKTQIAKKVGVSLSTVYLELRRGACEKKQYVSTNWLGEKKYKIVKTYSPELAEESYRQKLSSHGPDLKIADDFDFVNYIEKRVLVDKLSPCAALGEIKRKNLFKTNISKTTLYRYISMGIFYNIRMQDLPGKSRRKRYRKSVAKRPPKGTSIEQRPKDVLRRDAFGHWEMDCVVGKKESKETLLALSERLTRFEIVFKMPNRKTETVVKCLNKLERRFGSKFRQIFKTITVDNGSEFSDFAGLERSIFKGRRTRVFYCHPFTSCERGTNERLNREIRRLLPKGTDFSTLSNADVQRVTEWVNAYPREMFNYVTSAEMFDAQMQLLN